MLSRTIFLSRLVGIYSIVVAVSMLTHRSATIDMINEMIHSAPMLYLGGIIALVAGLAMVLTHNVWGGGALPVVVTLFGWESLIKGVLLLFLSPEAESRLFLDGLRYEQGFYFYTTGLLVLGVYMTFSSSRLSTPQAGSSKITKRTAINS